MRDAEFYDDWWRPASAWRLLRALWEDEPEVHRQARGGFFQFEVRGKDEPPQPANARFQRLFFVGDVVQASTLELNWDATPWTFGSDEEFIQVDLDPTTRYATSLEEFIALVEGSDAFDILTASDRAADEGWLSAYRRDTRPELSA